MLSLNWLRGVSGCGARAPPAELGRAFNKPGPRREGPTGDVGVMVAERRGDPLIWVGKLSWTASSETEALGAVTCKDVGNWADAVRASGAKTGTDSSSILLLLASLQVGPLSIHDLYWNPKLHDHAVNDRRRT